MLFVNKNIKKNHNVTPKNMTLHSQFALEEISPLIKNGISSNNVIFIQKCHFK